MKLISSPWRQVPPVKADQGKSGKFFSRLLCPRLAQQEAQKDELLQMLSFAFKQESDFKRDYGPGELSMAIEFFRDPLLNCTRFIADGAGLFKADPAKNARWKGKVYAALDKMDEFYASLPYEKMKGKPDLYPLFAIREMLPLIRIRVDRMFDFIADGKGQADADYWHDAIVRSKDAVMEVHERYIENMRALAQKISSDGVGWDRPISWKSEMPGIAQKTQMKSLRRLKQEARDLSRFYFMGMGARLTGIARSSEMYLKKAKNNEECEKELRNMLISLGQTTECYGRIPFETLHGASAYYPLFVANALLPTLHSEITSLRSSDIPEVERRVHRIGVLAYTFQTIGDCYRHRITRLLDEIHEMPGGDGFGVAFPPHMSTGISKRMERI